MSTAASRPERECPSRRYVFERHPRKKLKLPISDIKEVSGNGGSLLAGADCLGLFRR